MNLDHNSPPNTEINTPIYGQTQGAETPVVWRTKLGRVAAVAVLLTSGIGVNWLNNQRDESDGEKTVLIEPASQASYNNAAIADKALQYVGHWGGDACRDAHMLDNGNKGTTVGGPEFDGGECRTFVNCIVKMVSGGQQNIGWGSDNYFSALAANGQEIHDINTLSKGDVVQIGSYGTHTFIIVGRNKDNSFHVVDSNYYGYNKRVSDHDMFVTLSSNARAFRLGSIPAPAPPKPKPTPKPQPVPFDANKYKNHIVEWDNGPGEQHTSWLVGDDGKRYWIPDVPTFWCLRGKGIPDDGVQPSSVLDHLPDTGEKASCIPGLDRAMAVPEPLPPTPPPEAPMQKEQPVAVPPPKPRPAPSTTTTTRPPASTPPPTTPPPTTQRPPDTIPPPKKIILHVYNKVTNGSAMVEDKTPVRLTRHPHPYCNDECLEGTERNSGQTYEAAVCQTHGPYDTNGNNHDPSDDHNPGRYESTWYYGVRLADGRFGYTSDVWVEPSQRGGLNLPAC